MSILPIRMRLLLHNALQQPMRILTALAAVALVAVAVLWISVPAPQIGRLPADVRSADPASISLTHQQLRSYRQAALAAHDLPVASTAAGQPPPEQDDVDDDATIDALAVSAEGSARIYDAEAASLLQFAANHASFSASGFSFCPILNNATFDATVAIPALAQLSPHAAAAAANAGLSAPSVAQANIDQFTFVQIVDAKAWDIYRSILHQSRYGYKREPSPQELRRLACYFAAEGNSAYANFTRQRLLVDVEPQNYFRDRIPAIIPLEKSPIKGPRRKYLIAYLIMVHEVNGFMQLEKLLKALDDGDAIILIHVDARPKSEELHSLVANWITARSASTGRDSNVFLAKHRFCNIWGHSSLVFTQVSGFWELLDMADWDYVINLSNYDYPLRKNKDMHTVLSQEKYRDKNFIEYWPQTDDLAERFYRAHIGEADFSSLYHPSVLGITSWTYPRWRALKHHQWMIITPAFVKFLRQDSKALNFLAFAEHTYIPDEAYFATVLLNSPDFRDKVINDNKRYLRFAGSDAAHPSWLGFPDRFLFPANEPEPSFFFIRKLNVLGNVFQEDKLLRWIEENHRDAPALPGHNQTRPCQIEDASVRIDCLREYGSKFVSGNNELVVIPVNRAFLMLAANLRCSLRFVDIPNVVYWSLDLEVHESLLKKGRLSIFIPGFPSTNEAQSPGTVYFNRMMRYKPKLLAMLLDAGFNVWYMDADTVVLEDFRLPIVQDRSADIFLAIDNTKRVTARTTLHSAASALSAPVTLPHPSGGVMYLRQSVSAKIFVRMVMDTLEESVLMNDQDAMRRVLVNRDEVAATYVPATPKSRVIAAGNVPGAESKADEAEKARLAEAEARTAAHADSSKDRAGDAGADGIEVLERAAGKDAAVIHKDASDKDASDRAPAKDKRDLSSVAQEPPEEAATKSVRVKFLDQFEFMNGAVLFGNTKEIPVSYDGIKLVHLRHVENPAAVLGDWGLWFTDARGGCISDIMAARKKLYDQIASRAGWRL